MMLFILRRKHFKKRDKQQEIMITEKQKCYVKTRDRLTVERNASIFYHKHYFRMKDQKYSDIRLEKI